MITKESREKHATRMREYRKLPGMSEKIKAVNLANRTSERGKALNKIWRAKNKELLLANQREWRAKNKDRVHGYNLTSYKKHSEKRRAYARKYASEHLAEIRIRSKEWRSKNQERINKNSRAYRHAHPEKFRQYRANVKKSVLQVYGQTCACCGENRFEFLTIDHIAGGGTKHRDEIKKYGVGFYQWLKKNNFPTGYQTLCWNCNCSRGFYGICPHEKERKQMAAD